MHTYEIMLANGDRIFYKTSMSFEEFKNMISENEWIEIKRPPWTSNSSGGWSSRPSNALYQTKSIVYINWDKEQEEIDKKVEQSLVEQMPIKKEIVDYNHKNFRMWWKYRFLSVPWVDGNYWDEGTGFYRREYTMDFLEKLLADCKKYCKKKHYS